jgi:hypothetical protein
MSGQDRGADGWQQPTPFCEIQPFRLRALNQGPSGSVRSRATNALRSSDTRARVVLGKI